MTRKTCRIPCVTAGLALALGMGSASEAALLLNFTDSSHFSGADAGANVSPGQQVGGITGSTWNQINTGDPVSSIVDDAGNTLAGVTVDVGVAPSATTMLDYDEAPKFSNLSGAFDSGVFAGNAQSGMFNRSKDDSKVGVRVSGLAAGVYTIYATGLNTNADVINNFDIYVGAVSAASGDTDYAGFANEHMDFYNTATPKITDHWEEHINYVALTVTLGAGQDLVVVSDGTKDSEDRGFLNTVEIAAVPEPASLALLGVGGLLIATRRRGAAEGA